MFAVKEERRSRGKVCGWNRKGKTGERFVLNGEKKTGGRWD